jgi:fatty acid desaturase
VSDDQHDALAGRILMARQVAVVVGALSVSAGAWLAWPPAGLIVFGALLLGAGLGNVRGNP